MRRDWRPPSAGAREAELSVTKYDTLYKEDPRACGEPLSEVFAVLRELPSPARILDLGCGQGRDALPAARLGHSVIGVDVSAVGIRQLAATARSEGLELRAVADDVVRYAPDGSFDAVLLVRVLHMLRDDAARRAVLRKAVRVTRPGGVVLTADTPTHMPLIRKFFAAEAPAWSVLSPARGLLFFEKPRA